MSSRSIHAFSATNMNWLASLAITPVAVVSLCGFALCACGSSSDETRDYEGGTGGQSPAGCEADDDCKGDRVCQEGTCVDPSTGTSNASSSGGNSSSSGGNSCVMAGSDCSSDACCTGSICVSGAGFQTQCAAKCDVNSDCFSGCCAPLNSGGSVCAPASFCAPPGEVGDGCDTNAQCSSGFCAGTNSWCTMYCSNSYECPGNTWCIESAGNDQLCFPGCTYNSDCAAYPGSTCLATTTVDGISHSVCAF